MKATLIGATGLIGSEILGLLEQDELFTSIHLITRRPFESSNSKVTVSVIDFANYAEYDSALTQTDVLFCAIGTTNKKVKGDKAAYRKVDFDIPVNGAKISIEKSCSHFLLVSSGGANSESINFYARLKGEVESAICELPFNQISIFRPSLLLGNRKEFRLGEKIGSIIMRLFAPIIPKQYKAIQAKTVAIAMVKAAKKKASGVEIYSNADILKTAANTPV